MYTIHQHMRYNTWANGKLVEILGSADDKVMDTEIISSFPSIRKTVLHIWDAEQIWHTRLQGGSLKDWPSAGFKGVNKELLEKFLFDTKKFEELVISKDHDFLQKTLTYTNMKGMEFQNRVEDILFHVVNHGSFHRGQIITMLRQQGFEKFPPQDLIAFVREQS